MNVKPVIWKMGLGFLCETYGTLSNGNPPSPPLEARGTCPRHTSKLHFESSSTPWMRATPANPAQQSLSRDWVLGIRGLLLDPLESFADQMTPMAKAWVFGGVSGCRCWTCLRPACFCLRGAFFCWGTCKKKGFASQSSKKHDQRTCVWGHFWGRRLRFLASSRLSVFKTSIGVAISNQPANQATLRFHN